MTEAKAHETTLVGIPALNRRINTAGVMMLLRRHGPISRAELVRLSGIKANTISSIVDQFIAEGLAKETGQTQSTGGRPPVLVEIRPSGLYAVGIELDEHELQGVLSDFSGKRRSARTEPLSDTSPESVILHAKSLVSKLCEDAGVPRYKLVGIGLAMPGVVDSREHLVLFSYPLGWKNVPLGSMLADALKTEVRIFNNAVAGALHVYSKSEGREPVSLLFYLLTLKQFMRKGIVNLGCGIMLDGRPYAGKGHCAGEIAVAIDHPMETARKVLKKRCPKSVDDLLQASGDDKILLGQVWKPFGEELGKEVSRGIDYINPDRVIIGTDTPLLETLVGDTLRLVVRKKSVAGQLVDANPEMGASETPIQFQALDDAALASGVTLPFVHDLSQPPLLRESSLM